MSAEGTTHQAVVIGAGISGLSAATQLARSGTSTALVDDGYLGGLITNVGLLEDCAEWSGQSGADVVNVLLGEALEAGADYQMGTVSTLSLEGGLWHVPDLGLSATSVVLATGAQLRQIGVPGEQELTGRGVSQCAFCDGGLYKGKDVAVVGGGDSAYQEALHLAELCGTVTVLMRGTEPRARQSFVDRLNGFANVRVRPGIDVQEIVGESGVDAIRFIDNADGREEVLPTAAVFTFVGLSPQTALAPSAAERDDSGALIVDEKMQTSSANLYAIGAARSGYGGSIGDALSDARLMASALSRG